LCDLAIDLLTKAHRKPVNIHDGIVGTIRNPALRNCWGAMQTGQQRNK
jgi:hypothetical protein